MRRLISITASLIIVLSLCNCVEADTVTPYIIESYTYEDIDTLIELIAEQISYMNAAHEMAEAARQLDHPEIVDMAKVDYEQADALRQKYQAIYDNLSSKWHQKEEEYPVATYIWNYFKQLGYNNQVCAGILGNIMTEVGGNTLDIQWDLDSSAYYGMCQWSKKYATIRKGATLEDQCNYLRDDIQKQFEVFGYLYKKGFTYEDFLNLEDTVATATAFAKVYERCDSRGYKARQKNAAIAYEYFMS